MPLGHRLQPRSRLWPITLVALLVWGFVDWRELSPKTDAHSIALTARRVIENTVLAYDDAIGSAQPEVWQSWRRDDVADLQKDLERESLMSDSLWVDCALVYHHFAQTSGDPRWDERARSALLRVRDQENGSNYFWQVQSTLKGASLSAAKRAELVNFRARWAKDWWISELAIIHGLDIQLARQEISGRQARAGIQAWAELAIQVMIAVFAVLLAGSAWRLLKSGQSHLIPRPGDKLRHLRWLWSPAAVLLCFALAGLIAPVVSALLNMIPAQTMRHLVGVGWQRWVWIVVLVLLAVGTAVIEPFVMRWCFARRHGGLRRLFDLRVADFCERRWWLLGIAGSCALFLVFFCLNWFLEKMGLGRDGSDSLARTHRELGVLALPCSLLWGTIMAPFVEEVVFRGFLFTALKNQYGRWAGAIVSSAVFTYGHFYGWLGTLEVFVMGLVFCFLYDRTHRLAVPMILHACINFPLCILRWLDWSA